LDNDRIVCPFCGEDDFDRIGLKMHFLRGWCDAFNDTPDTDPPKEDRPAPLVQQDLGI
jgi:hypothetical protein